jgi:hypothetical protein
MATSRKHQGSPSNGDTTATILCDVPPGNGDFIDQTIAIWQKRTERKLTREDGREIIENITGFFSILQEWKRKERAAEQAKSSRSLDSDGRRTRQNADIAATAFPSSAIKAES